MGKRYQIMAIETMMQNTPAIHFTKTWWRIIRFWFWGPYALVSLSFFQLNQPFTIDIHSPFEYVICWTCMYRIRITSLKFHHVFDFFEIRQLRKPHIIPLCFHWNYRRKTGFADNQHRFFKPSSLWKITYCFTGFDGTQDQSLITFCWRISEQGNQIYLN